jgi:hypothetical protein
MFRLSRNSLRSPIREQVSGARAWDPPVPLHRESTMATTGQTEGLTANPARLNADRFVVESVVRSYAFISRVVCHT